MREVCTGGFTGGGAGAAWTRDPRMRAPVTVEGAKAGWSAAQVYAVWDRLIDELSKAADFAWRLQSAYDQFKAASTSEARLVAAKRYTDELKAANEAKADGEWIDRRLQPKVERDLWNEIEAWLKEEDQRQKAEESKSQKEWEELLKDAGDKRIYIEKVRSEYAVYTYRGITVKTPADLKKATGLFRCVVDGRTGTWSVYGGIFKGNKEEEPYTETGVGTTCPTRAYPRAEPK